MKHFLITRFNLKNKHWKNDKDEYVVLTKEWLDDRFHLFETFCLPSVKNQTNNHFHWYVFFDIDTPVVYLKRIHAIADGFMNFKPVFVDGFENLDSSLESQIKNALSATDQYIITTRLDNDDSIHKNFIKTIQDLFVPKGKTVIDLRSGYQVILNNSGAEYRMYNTKFNPFISLISHVSSLETVISKEHSHWKVSPNLIVNNNDYLWVQLIHDKNKLNQKLAYLKKTNQINSKDFGIELPKSTVSSLHIFFYNLLMVPYRIFFNSKAKVKSLKNIRASKEPEFH